MAVANRVLAEGRLTVYEPHLPGTDDQLSGMVGVVSPITGQRRILHAVPVELAGALIAVPSATTGTDATDAPQAACAPGKATAVLAVGRFGANTPIPGRPGPADLIGCGPMDGSGPCELRTEAERLCGCLVRLEVHGPGCACAQALESSAGPATGAGHG
ncbi:hypothetical protein [Glycomyces sp. NPDC047010]|uniref:hypothetical protein n=1 Tax=Glycomyces sp. NPDC047010 TaxID=3155023 RepID=UPI0033FD700E